MIKLSESEKDLLNKLSVRTAKLNSEYQQYDQGSGTLFASGDNCYVLTAGHCVNDVDEHHIVVEYYNGSIYVNTRYVVLLCVNTMKKLKKTMQFS